MRLGHFNPTEKLLYHSDIIAKWNCGERIYPILIEWFLTNYCNHKCDFCSFSHSHSKGFMDTKIVLKTLSELSELGVKAINWTGGGEPLLHPDFTTIAEHAYFCGIEQGLFTNGSLLTKDIAKVIGKTHKWVRFSVDAGMDRTFKEIKGVNDYKKVIDNLCMMVDYKENCTVGGGFVITKDNFQDIEMFVNQMEYCGVDYIQFKPQIHPYFDDKQEEAEFWNKKIRPKLERVSNNPKVMVNLYKFRDLEETADREYNICYGWEFCPCIADGKVYRCNYLAYMEEHCLGNLKDKTFAEIWKEQNPMKPCKECQLLCKNDAINKILYSLKHNRGGHENFL